MNATVGVGCNSGGVGVINNNNNNNNNGGGGIIGNSVNAPTIQQTSSIPIQTQIPVQIATAMAATVTTATAIPTATNNNSNNRKIIYYDCLENTNNNKLPQKQQTDITAENTNKIIKININNNITNTININNYKINNWDLLENYELVNKIGNGKYGTVFLGINIQINSNTDNKCAIKILRPILQYQKLIKEAEFLDKLKACPNIIKLLTCIYDEASKNLSLVFEYINNVKYTELFTLINDNDIRYYAYQLLLSLNYLYEKCIMHRDIKPQNVMIDHSKRIIKLIDFGLAEYYKEGRQYSIHVASRYYKAPELLSNYNYYSNAIDMWSYGLMIASLLLKTEPIFRGSDVFNQLSLIIQALGIRDYKTFLIKYKLKWSTQIKLPYNTRNIVERRNLKEFCKIPPSTLKQVNITSNIEDLLNSILRLDPAERLTPPQALQHKYFENVKPDSSVKVSQKAKQSSSQQRNASLFHTSQTMYQQHQSNLIANKKTLVPKTLKSISVGSNMAISQNDSKSNFLKTIKRRTHSDIMKHPKNSAYFEKSNCFERKMSSTVGTMATSSPAPPPPTVSTAVNTLRATTEPNLMNFRRNSICFR